MSLEVIISNQSVPYLNLAVEQALVANNPSDTVVMYLWKNRQTVVIGLNQNPYAECNVDCLLKDGGYLMRRMTGGGAVYHDLGNLNFSFVAGHQRYDQARQFSVLQKAVESFGLRTEISGRNDVLCDGRKFSGNAFSVGKQNRLHHGTILIRTDMDRLQRYLKPKPAKLHKHGIASVESRVVNLSEWADITSDNIIPPLIASLGSVYGEEPRIRSFEEICTEAVKEQARCFADEDFLYGKWRQFHARQKGSFAWGEVEIDLDVDEASHKIRGVEIATDCLRLSVIEEIKECLKNADLSERPHWKASDEDAEIWNDIFDLIYA